MFLLFIFKKIYLYISKTYSHLLLIYEKVFYFFISYTHCCRGYATVMQTKEGWAYCR